VTSATKLRTLQLAGAVIPAAVVIGRYLNPGYNEAATQLWERARSRAFTFERCCRCDTPWPAARLRSK